MMNRPIRAIAIAATVLLAGCTDKPADYFSGYAEADYVRVAAPIAGTVTKLYVKRGDKLPAGAPAFVLEQDSERAAQAEAAFRMQRAEAQVADLKKGKRPDELTATREQLAQAQAALRLSTASLARQRQLIAAKFISPAQLDEAQAAVARDQAHVKELEAQVRVAQLGARSDEIAAAEQEVNAAQAQLAQVKWRLTQKSQRIPVAAEVTDVLYREGEWVQAGSPIVTLLPPQNIKARFFVSEPTLGSMHIGQDVSLQCDGCGAPIPAKISFIASAPEYTSPLIYSKENRSTLVFMLEAQPAAEDARRLHPGQPLEIRLTAPVAKPSKSAS